MQTIVVYQRLSSTLYDIRCKQSVGRSNSLLVVNQLYRPERHLARGSMMRKARSYVHTFKLIGVLCVCLTLTLLAIVIVLHEYDAPIVRTGIEGKPQALAAFENAVEIAKGDFTWSFRFSPDRSLCGFPDGEGGLQVCDEHLRLRTHLKPRSGPSGILIWAFCFSHDNRFLVAYLPRLNEITLWDLESASEVWTVKGNAGTEIVAFAFSDDNQKIIGVEAKDVLHNDFKSSSFTQCNYYDPRNGTTLGVVSVSKAKWFVSLSGNGHYLLMSAHNMITSNKLTSVTYSVIELSSGKTVFEYGVPTKRESVLLFMSEDSQIAYFDFHGITVWDLQTGSKLSHCNLPPSVETAFEQRFRQTRIWYMAFRLFDISPDNKKLAVGWFGQPGTIGVIDILDGRLLELFQAFPGKEICKKVGFGQEADTILCIPESLDTDEMPVRNQSARLFRLSQ